MELRRILCPVDFSDLSALALRYAALLASCGEVQLTVMHADSFSPPPYFTAGNLERLERQFRDDFREAEAAVRRFVQKELGDQAAASVDVRIVEALPVDGIRRLARETSADLIVMGTHGRSGVNRFMLGSVAERVLRESEIPVLTVRGDTTAAVAAPKNLLCPVNDTPTARQALSVAASLTRCFGANLTVLHVSESGAGQDAAQVCAGELEEIRPHCSVKELTRKGDAAEQIVALARETPCDLLVVGAQHRRFFDTTVLGSTTARVVRHAPCPVLTVSAKPV